MSANNTLRLVYAHLVDDVNDCLGGSIIPA